MAKLIRKHFGKLVSVEPNTPSGIDKEWSWRKAYEGFYGIIHVYESRHRFSGKHFIVIYDIDFDYLKTGVGELTYEGKRILLNTRNSRYAFTYIDLEKKDGD